MAYYLSRKEGDEVVCGCEPAAGCTDSETITAAFSGVGTACPTCVGNRTGISNEVNGSHSAGVTVPLQTWATSIDNGFDYNSFSTPDCSDEPVGHSVALIIAISCVDGIYSVLAVGDDVILFFAENVQISVPASNTSDSGCGGSVTLSIP